MPSEATGDVYVDINAGDGGQGYMLFHAAHEYGHHIVNVSSDTNDYYLHEVLLQKKEDNASFKTGTRKGAPGEALPSLISLLEKIRDVNSAVKLSSRDASYLKAVEDGDMDTAQRMVDEAAKAAADGRVLTETEAQEEMFADAMQEMFTQGNIEERLAKLKGEDRSLWQQFKDFVSKLLADIKAIYKKVQPESEEAIQLRKNMDAFEKIADMFTEASVEAGQKFEAMKGATVADTGIALATEVSWSGRDLGQASFSARNLPTREQIEQNIETVRNSDSVHSVASSKLEKSGVKIDEQYKKAFEKIGNKILVEGFGVVNLTNSSVRSERRHGSTPPKIAAIEAIPSVLQRGKIVDVIEKAKGVYRIIFAAPITIGTEKYGMGVMVQSDPNTQRLYLHDVVLIKKEIDADSLADLNSNRDQQNADNNLYITTILQKVSLVNTGNTELSARDASYLKAVEDGDMETAQRMVDEAAKAAFPDSAIRDKNGNLLKVRHGTDADFWSFDITKHGGKHGTTEGYGIYLTDKPEVSESYGDRQIVGYANIVRPARDNRKTIKRSELSRLVESTVRHEAERMVEEDGYDSVEEAMFDTWISNYVYTYEYSGIRAAMEAVADVLLKMDDNDADIVQEVMNGMGIRDSAGASAFYDNDLTPTTGIDGIWRVWNRGEGSREANIILAFRSEQIKSADPVTYDDDGNVIPLSERFNAEERDIRFSGRGGTSDSPLQWTENEVKLSSRGYEKPPIGINNDFVFDHFTQEHKSAVKWANREDVHVRDRALVFYRNRWYVIEKYDDMDHGYLVRFVVRKSELKNYIELRRLNNDGRNAKTLAEQHSRIDSDHRREIGNERPRNESDDDALEYATEDQEIFGLDENKRRGRDDNSNNSAGAVGSDADRAGLGTAGLKFSSRDASYLKAVEDGDMETAQRMVDEAAKAAGYVIKAYHYGAKGINEFQSGNSAGLIYFAEDMKNAKKAARSKEKLYSAYLKISNPVNSSETALNWYEAEDSLKNAQWRRNGFDAVFVKDEAEISIAVFNPSQIKSADPVTYDDDGNIIPLSERFNAEKKDIRYSGRVTDGQAKFSSRKEVLNRNDVDWMDDFSSIKDQLQKHRAEIGKQKNVAAVEYGGEDKGNLERLILEQVKKVGGERFVRNGLTFSFDKKGIHSIVLHARTPELRAAALAAPYVAKRGILIAGQKDHEKTNTTTLTFAAPVRIDSEETHVGVVIQFANDGRARAVNLEYLDQGQKKKPASGLRSRTSHSYVSDLLTNADFYKKNSTDSPISQEKSSVKLSSRDPNATDARTLLSNALLETAQTDAERDLLERYQAKIGDRNKDDVRLGKIRDQIREMMFAKGPRDAAYKGKLAKLNAQAKTLSDRIARADRKLLEMAQTDAERKVLFILKENRFIRERTSRFY